MKRLLLALDRAAFRAAHRLWPLLAVLFGPRLIPSFPSFWSDVIVYSGLPLLIWGFWGLLRHGFCYDCMLLYPLDAQKQAERRKWLLWIAHKGLWIVGSAILLDLFDAYLTVSWNNLKWYPLDIPLGALFCLMLYAGRRHLILQPKCPYCHRGGRGRDDDEDAPPTPPGGLGLKQPFMKHHA